MPRLTNQQIDELLHAIKIKDFVKIISFIDDESLKSKISVDDNLVELEEEIIANIMNQIVEVGYEYFYSKLISSDTGTWLLTGLTDEVKIKNVLNHIKLPYQVAIDLLGKIKDVNYIEQYISYTNLFHSDEINIIIATKNIEFIKKCILNEELLRGTSVYLAKLAMATNDIDYIKEHIEIHKKSYDSKTLAELIRFTNDEKYIQEYISDKDTNIELKAILISGIKDKEYIKQYITENLDNLSIEVKLELLKSTDDKEYIKECIYDKNFVLNSFAKTYLIAYINDVEYTKKCINDEKLYLEQKHKVELLQSIRDEEYIYEVLKFDMFSLEKNDKYELIKSFNMGFVKKCVFSKELQLDESLQILLIELFSDALIKECIENSDISLSRNGILKLVKYMNDEEYTTEVINGKFFELNMLEKVGLIKSQSDSYIYEYLVNKKIEFSADDIEILIANIKDENIKRQILYNDDLDICLEWRMRFALEIQDKEIIGRYLKLYPELSILTGNSNINYEKINKKFNLPSQMTIGIEIESEGKASKLIEQEFGYKEWTCVGDGSLMDGIEIVSPILRPTIEDSKQIYAVTKMLSCMGQKATQSCGGHIHIGANFLKSKQAWANLLEIWCNTEKILFAISNKEGTPPRERVVKYAAPIASKVQDALDAGIVNLESEEELNQFVVGLKNIQLSESSKMDVIGIDSDYDRYYSLNLCNLDSRLHTIEFRLANGTLDPELWIENINLFGGIVTLAQELSELKNLQYLTLEQQRKIEIFEKLKTDITEKEKLEIIIDLIGLEPEGYIKRFNANIKLLENDISLTKKLSVGKPIIVKKKPIITVAEIEETVKDVDTVQASEVIRNIRHDTRISENNVEKD